MLQNLPGNAVLGARAFGRSIPPWVISASLAVSVAISYFLAARLSLALLTNPDGVAVFWPAAGVSAGVLITLGPKARLSVILGVMAATIAANLLGDRNIPSSIVFAACNAFEAVLVAGLKSLILTIESRLRGIGTLRARTGIIVDDLLLYVTGGLAVANFTAPILRRT